MTRTLFRTHLNACRAAWMAHAYAQHSTPPGDVTATEAAVQTAERALIGYVAAACPVMEPPTPAPVRRSA